MIFIPLAWAKRVKEKTKSNALSAESGYHVKRHTKIREQAKHATAILVEFKYGVDNDYETGANMKMATASFAHDINIVFEEDPLFISFAGHNKKFYTRIW